MNDKIRLAWKSINRTRLWLLLAAVLVIILATVTAKNWERREVIASAKANGWLAEGPPEDVAGREDTYCRARPPNMELEIKLTDEVRAKLRGWTEDFLKTRPPSTWLRERGMSPVVYAR